MIKSVGLVELNSVARGVLVADEMVKEANVELILARPVCPGRYLAMVAGDTGAVKRSVEKGILLGDGFLADHFTLANIHKDIIPAIHGASIIPEIRAIGIIETYSSSSAIVAADRAAKAADIGLVEVRLATGLAGKAVVTLTGKIGAVKAAVESAVHPLRESGLLLADVVISAPDAQTKQAILF